MEQSLNAVAIFVLLIVAGGFGIALWNHLFNKKP